jgi:pilus assembly protein TadC
MLFSKMEWRCIVEVCLFFLALYSSISIALWIFHFIASLLVSSSLWIGILKIFFALCVGVATCVAIEYTFQGVLKICNITILDIKRLY